MTLFSANGIKVHGQSKRHKWLKIHVAVDPKTGEVVTETTTLSNLRDSEALGPILDQVPRSCRRVLADGANDGKACREMIRLRGADALIPPPKNARIHHKDEGRDDAVRIMRTLGRSL